MNNQQIESNNQKPPTDVASGAVLGVTVGDGKYTVQQDASGRLTALRYGEPWRDCCGDGLIYQLAAELQDAREALQRIASYPIHSEPTGAAMDMQEIAAALVTPNEKS
jgi:hypothetical protein